MIPSVYGGFWRRAAAILVDKAILMLLSIILFFLGLMGHLAAAGSGQLLEDLLLGHTTAMTRGFIFLYYLTVFLLSLIYFSYFIGYTGQTPGKMLFGLYVSGVNGKNLTFRRAFIRSLGYILSGMVFYLGFLWVIFDRRKQGWHDKLAGSIVIHIPRDRIIPAPPEETDGKETILHEDSENEKDLDKEKGIY